MAEVLIDRRYMQRVPALIESAQVCVRVAMFQMMVKGKGARGNARELGIKLAAKALEGKDVRVLINMCPGGSRIAAINRDAAAWLRERKVRVRCLGPSRVCHAKLVLVDEKLAIIGSHNWGVSALSRNFEVSVVVRDAEQVGKLVDYFDTLWSVSKEVKG